MTLSTFAMLQLLPRLGITVSASMPARTLSTSARVMSGARVATLPPQVGEFVRPESAPANAGLPAGKGVAQPHPPPGTPVSQAPNALSTWSEDQNPRTRAMRGPRFEQTNMAFQPQPLAAMSLIANEPIRMVNQRVVSCDGGDGPLGHPKVFINLDKPGGKACPYWFVSLSNTCPAQLTAR